MDTIIQALREILGEPDFYVQMGSNMSYSWDYGAMVEYFIGATILCIVISSVFRIIVRWADR